MYKGNWANDNISRWFSNRSIDFPSFLPSSLGIHTVISLKRQFPITSAIILSSESYLFQRPKLWHATCQSIPDKSKSQISITDPYGPKLLTIFHKTTILLILLQKWVVSQKWDIKRNIKRQTQSSRIFSLDTLNRSSGWNAHKTCECKWKKKVIKGPRG